MAMFENNSLKTNDGRPAETHETVHRREVAPMTKHQNHEHPVSLATIGSTIYIKGDLSGEEGLVIQGHVEGTINLQQSNLIIGQEGKVFATIRANTITIEGSLMGDVNGEERVIVKKTGNVQGNITAPKVSLEEGAKFKGCMDMDYISTASPASPKVAASASVVKLDTSASNENAPLRNSGDLK
jgi:cytoskeletal protein CcmA (bactofilin family)